MKHMIINGGLDTNEQPLQDLWSYNMETLKWNGLIVEKHIPALSHHTATAVFYNQSRYSNIYKKTKNYQSSANEPKVSFPILHH